MDFRAQRKPGGAVRQSGLNARLRTPNRMPPLFVRGVVIATYVTDDPQNPDAILGQTPTAIYCDVLTYSSVQGAQRFVLPRCLVCQDFGGLQSGVVYRPRAATLDVSGQTLDLASCAIGQLDGDHVLCSYLDGNLDQPIIVRGLPHPSADVGQAAGQGDAGAHLKLTLVDGAPYTVKHHGSFFGIDAKGNFEANTLFANDGSLKEKGAEPPPPTDATLGNQTQALHAHAQKMTAFYDMSVPTAPVLALQEILTASQKLLQFESQSADFKVADSTGTALRVTSSGAQAVATIGNGAVHPAIAEHLQVLYNNLYAWLTAHTHPTAVGLSGPPVAPAPPAYDQAINSQHLAFPDGS